MGRPANSEAKPEGWPGSFTCPASGAVERAVCPQRHACAHVFVKPFVNTFVGELVTARKASVGAGFSRLRNAKGERFRAKVKLSEQEVRDSEQSPQGEMYFYLTFSMYDDCNPSHFSPKVSTSEHCPQREAWSSATVRRRLKMRLSFATSKSRSHWQRRGRR